MLRLLRSALGADGEARVGLRCPDVQVAVSINCRALKGLRAPLKGFGVDMWQV